MVKTSKVMVLGCYHMSNPNRDVAKLQVPDVCTPEKQAQLAEVALRLARFAPNKIALEVEADLPNLETSLFHGFTADQLLHDRDERTQIGLRLAHVLGHRAVYGIDEQNKEINYFPLEKVQEFAIQHGQKTILEQIYRHLEQSTQLAQHHQHEKTIGELLLQLNRQDHGQQEMQQLYMPLMKIGDSTTQPGAELNAMWYMRNAKIFAKLRQITEPDDKILVLFGSGHLYWLQQMIQLSPELELVQADSYLV